MAGFYSREYAQKDTMQRAATMALDGFASELGLRTALANAGGPTAAAVGYGYDESGLQIGYYRVGDLISAEGVLIAPNE